MTDDRTNSQIYILRLWAVNATEGQSAEWHASLEDSQTGKRIGFANLEQLFVYLMETTKRGDGTEPGDTTWIA